MKLKVLFFCFFVFVFLTEAFSQRFHCPLGRFYDLDMQQLTLKDSVEKLSLVKPVLFPENKIDTIYKEKIFSWLDTHFFEDDFLKFASKKYSLTVNPILDLELYYQKDLEDGKKYFLNTRGFEAFGRLGKRIFFKTEFYENQSRFLPFRAFVIKSRNSIVPSCGYAKPFETDGLDYAVSISSISFDVNRNFKLSFGNDRNFIGSGYRSVILSDLTFPYPYLRMDFNYKKFYYYALGSYLHDGLFSYYNYMITDYKYAVYHILGYKPLKNLEIALVESNIWCKNDNSFALGYDINYGLFDRIKFYTQGNYQGKHVDINSEEKQLFSFNCGVHFFDFLSFLVDGLNSHAQFEYTVSRYDKNNSKVSFWSYCYPLTTPFVMDKNSGAEAVCFVDFEYKRAAVDVKYLTRNSSCYKDLTLRYFLNKKTKWNLFVCFSSHNCSKEYYSKDWDYKYITAGISITPANSYFDF